VVAPLVRVQQVAAIVLLACDVVGQAACVRVCVSLLYVVFVQLTKLFDSVDRTAVCGVAFHMDNLEKSGENLTFIREKLRELWFTYAVAVLPQLR